jgi:plastocyanin
MYPSAVLLFVASALFSTSKAADFAVLVGQGGLQFSPDHVSGAVVGDTVTFQFQPSGHTATQGSFNTPCTQLAGGFNSGTYVVFFSFFFFGQEVGITDN